MKYCGANNELICGRCDLDFTFADPKIDIDTTTGDIKETQQGHNLRNQIATDTEYDGGGYLFPAPTATLSLSPGMGREKYRPRLRQRPQQTQPGNRNPADQAWLVRLRHTHQHALLVKRTGRIHAATVTATGIDAPTKIASVPGQNVLGFA